MAQKSTLGSALSAWFFLRPVSFRIGTGNHGARLAQPKAPLPEQALTLAHRQVDFEALLDPSIQRFSIPQRARQAQVARDLAQHPFHFLQLRLTQTPGTPGALPSEAGWLKAILIFRTKSLDPRRTRRPMTAIW
jgi:hypothetical protein